MTISDEAVDAAYRRMWMYFNEPEMEGRDALRLALEAASPHMTICTHDNTQGEK